VVVMGMMMLRRHVRPISWGLDGVRRRRRGDSSAKAKAGAIKSAEVTPTAAMIFNIRLSQ